MIFYLLFSLTDLGSSFARINGTGSAELFSIHISHFSALGFLTNTEAAWFIWKRKNDLTHGIHNYMLKNKKSPEKNKIYNMWCQSVTVKNYCRDFWATWNESFDSGVCWLWSKALETSPNPHPMCPFTMMETGRGFITNLVSLISHLEATSSEAGTASWHWNPGAADWVTPGSRNWEENEHAGWGNSPNRHLWVGEGNRHRKETQMQMREGHSKGQPQDSGLQWPW